MKIEDLKSYFTKERVYFIGKEIFYFWIFASILILSILIINIFDPQEANIDCNTNRISFGLNNMLEAHLAHCDAEFLLSVRPGGDHIHLSPLNYHILDMKFHFLTFLELYMGFLVIFFPFCLGIWLFLKGMLFCVRKFLLRMI